LSLGKGRAGGRPSGERSGTAETLGKVLDGLLQQAPWGGGLVLGELGRRWSEVVGETLSRECTPTALQGEVLLVRASSAPWAAQLRFLQSDIAARANEVLGSPKVREVRVTVAP
jgi:predicted nucleic acid-binding Zn ribbon protein